MSNGIQLKFMNYQLILLQKDSFDIGLHKDMRKSSFPSLSNCNSVLANKIFGIPLDELQQEGQPGNEVPFIVRHVVDYIEEHGKYGYNYKLEIWIPLFYSLIHSCFEHKNFIY